MVLQRREVILEDTTQDSPQQDVQKPENAVMYTAIEIFLKDMDEEEVDRLVGVDEVNLKSIASNTQASLLFNPSALTVYIGGELSCVRAANQALKAQMSKIRERGALNEAIFNLISKDFEHGLKFEPEKDLNSWRIQPAIADGTSGIGDGNLVHTIEQASAVLLKRFSYMALTNNVGLKMNLNLGTSSFTRPFTSDMKMEEAHLTPGELTKLLEAKELSCHYNLEHDEASIAELETSLASLGYKKSLNKKTTIYISHREVVDRRAKEIVWVAKPKEQTGECKGHLELIDVRVNEVRTCLIATHSVSNIFNCHMEFTIFQKETPSVVLLHSGRLGHNYRYQEGAGSLICSKEISKDPSARVQISTAYVKGDSKVTITKIRESQSLVDTWEVCVKSAKLKEIIRSALSGGSVISAQLSTGLQHYFHAVAEIRSNFIGLRARKQVGNTDTQALTTMPLLQKLNANAESFQPKSQSLTSRDSSDDNLRTAIQLRTKPENIQIPEAKQFVVGLGTSNMNNTPFHQKALDFPVLKPYIATRQIPLTAVNNPFSNLQSKSSFHRFIQSSRLGETLNLFASLEGRITDREGEIDPPNTPATPSGPGSPVSRSSRSRAGSIACIDDGDDLCGISRGYPQVPMSPQLKKAPLDLLAPIDELCRDTVDEADDDLICMSPSSNRLFLVNEEDDLLVV